MLVFITDLDGTLLDKAFSYEAAEPALRLLSQLRIPLVLCTSKTRAEVEACRILLDNHHPFIVENGGALYIPERCFPLAINSPVHRDGYAVIEFGDPYPELVRCLLQASVESKCFVRGFHQMDVEEVSARCNMSVAAASLAKEREYDEPFEILGGDVERLTDAIKEQKKRWTRGGSFYHILGSNDKAHCASLLIHFYTRIYGNVITVGLGDGLNDAGFLNLVDIPILMESPAMADLKKAVPRGRQSPGPGPQGWNSAVLNAIEQNLFAQGKAIGIDAVSEEFSSL
jgi:mannosyl-3-phosphoglycerate phosphatase family protein